MNRMLAAAALSLAPCLWAQDHPLVSVYPGSKLSNRTAVEFDEFQFPVSKMWANKFTKALPLEGKIESLSYKNPEERSTLELFRNYETAIKTAGFQILFSCSREDCGDGDTGTQVGHFAPRHDTRYIAAKLPRPEGDVYVSINISGYYRDTWIRVIEVKPMESLLGRSSPAAESRAGSASQASPTRSQDASPQPTPQAGGGRAPEEVETGIIRGLNGFGLQAKAGAASQPADIVVEGKVTTTPMQGDGSRWKWARSTVTVKVKDGRTGKIFLSFDASDRQASGDYNEAARRSHVELAKKVSAQIRDAITEYFENQ